MTKAEPFVPHRLREVWQWKEAAYREVADLPLDRALAEILNKARLSAEKVDLPRRCPSRAVPRAKR